MRTVKASHRTGSAASFFVAVSMLVLWSSESCGADPVREGFEGLTIAPAFVACARPENRIGITRDKARSGKQSLALIIRRQPLFEQSVRVLWSLNPASCLIASQEPRYWGDDDERAELWENMDTGPSFGDELYYGFSMWIDAAGAPYGDYNRIVVGQWKAVNDVSPFLAQRLTGGFYHITLDVDARLANRPDNQPRTCKVLLAFSARAPSDLESALLLTRPIQCESKLEWPGNDLMPMENLEIKRERYLPEPIDRWTDLVFRVKGGPAGVVQVWADGQLVATAEGWIGHKSGVGQRQYFKFGTYRDPAGYESGVYLDNLARGGNYNYVDPSQW